MAKKIGIIIVTHNAEVFIEACLETVLNNKYSNFHVVVVDNNSTDNTIRVLENYKYANLLCIKNKVNVGFSPAVNIGVNKLSAIHDCELFLILNPDTVVTDNLLSSLVAAFDKDSALGICGCVITYLDEPTKIWYAGGIVNKTFFYTRHSHMNRSLDEIIGLTLPADFVTGCCMMFTKEAFHAQQGFDADCILYFEDVFFSLRAAEKGFKVCVLNKALVKHNVSSSTGYTGTNKLSPLRAYFLARNPFIFLRTLPLPLLLSGFCGQICIRLTFYTLFCIKNRDFGSIYYYILGLSSGIKFLLTGKFSGHPAFFKFSRC